MKGAVIGLSLLAAFAIAVVLIVSSGTEVPDGPLPVAWDRAPCAHCHMQIGEPRHAAQLITSDGRVSDFDDVGCAVAYLRQHRPAVHRLWFHGEGDSWLAAEAVGFVTTEVTPMGSGWLAVDRHTADAKTLEQIMTATGAPAAPGGPR